jgi:hypothetical protein
MPLTLSANIEIFNMVPILVTLRFPVRPTSIIAALTHSTATFIATMVQQVIPGSAVEVAFRTFMVVWRVADVLVECMGRAVRSVAAFTPPATCQQREDVHGGHLHGHPEEFP